jgi:hypothetical protein
MIGLWISSCKEIGPKTSKKSLEDIQKQYSLNLTSKETFENFESLRSLYGDSVYISEIYIKGIDTIKAENKLVDIICNSNEVEEMREYLQGQSSNIQSLTCEIWRKPTEISPFYWIKVFDNKSGHTLTDFNFFVRLFPFEILFYDEEKDEIIDLKSWKKKLNH